MNRREMIVGAAACMTVAVVPVASSALDYASVADIGPREYGPGCRMYNDHGTYEMNWTGYDALTPERVTVIAGSSVPVEGFYGWLGTLRAGHDMVFYDFPPVPKGAHFLRLAS